MINRTIHFLIPALSRDEPAHILSLPDTFAVQDAPLEIPLPSGKCILAPSPSELFHYYESVQPQMNHIISSSEGNLDHLTAESFIHLVENLSEYSIPCPVLENQFLTSIDKSTSMLSIDDYFQSSPLYDQNYMDQFTESVSTINDDPNLYLHNDNLASNVSYCWTTIPVSQMESSEKIHWKSIESKKKNKMRHGRKRTKFTSEDLEILNLFFEKNPMPSRSDISILSEKLAYPRYIVQVWFYNKRQSMKRANSSASQIDHSVH